MRKMRLMLSLLVIALFVVSCAPKESPGEDGALAGQAVKLSKKTEEGLALSAKIAQCSQLAQDCGFVKKSDLNLDCTTRWVEKSTPKSSTTPKEYCKYLGYSSTISVLKQEYLGGSIQPGYKMFSFSDDSEMTFAPDEFTSVSNYFVTCCKFN